MDALYRAARWSGWPLAADQHRQLLRYGDWLRREAIPSGALGPNEGERLRVRHLADSLLFAGGWTDTSPPARSIDLGSGAGLPGIPLAILWPRSQVMLIERRGGRADLLRRAVRVLDLANVRVVHGDAARVPASGDLVVARAAGRPREVASWARRMVHPGGRIVMGGSWEAPPEPEEGEEIVVVPPEVLDRPVWLRIMAAS